MSAQKFHHSSRRVVRRPSHAAPSSCVFIYKPPTFTAETHFTSSTVPRDVTRVRVHGSVRAIQPRAFQDCSDLVEVELPGELESIRAGAFLNCTSLIRVDIPCSVAVIGKGSFEGCTSLEEADLQ